MNQMNNVSYKIIEDAKNEAESILKQAKEKADNIINEAELKVKIAKKQANEIAKKKFEETYKLKIMQIEANEKQKLLQKKLELIDNIIEDIKTLLKKSDEKQFKKYLKKVFEQINIKEGEILAGTKEKINIDFIIKEAKKYKIKLNKSKQKPDFDFGIKIIHGKVRYEISPVDYIYSNRESIGILISKELFAEE